MGTLEREIVKPKHHTFFIKGAKAGTPIAIGYIPIGMAFGLLAKSTGLPGEIALMMSLIVFAGASQFVAVNLLAVGAASAEIILTTFIINLRHLLMTSSLAQRLPEGLSRKSMALLAYGVTDESFTVASLQDDKKIHPSFLLGLNLIGFVAWNIGTAAGLFLASGLPSSVQSSMGIALYAMFVGLLIPSMRKSRPVLITALLAAAIHSLLHWIPPFSGISTGWSIVIATILAAGTAGFLFPEGVENNG